MSDMTAEIAKLLHMLPYGHESCRSISDFHVRFLGRVVHLAVKSCLKLVRKEVTKIRNMISSICESTQRRDLFERIRIELGESEALLPQLDMEVS